VTPAELNKEISGGKFRPVYFFFGSEEYRIKEAEKALVQKFLGIHARNGHKSLAASRLKASDIFTELSIVPMLGDRQVFSIADTHILTPSEMENIFKILTPPDPSRIVIFFVPAAKVPTKNQRQKTKWFGFLESKTEPVEFTRLSASDTQKRLAALFTEKGINIEIEALTMLSGLADGDLGGIFQEAAKLIDFVGPDGTITRSQVAAITSDHRAYNIFELADKVAGRDIDTALRVLHTLQNQGESASNVLFWLSEHFLNLYLAKNRKPLPPRSRNMAWKYNQQVNLFSNEILEALILIIGEGNRRLRGDIANEWAIIEDIVIQLVMKIEESSGRN